jgi:predicted O-methyltransferase YrrM
MFDETITAYAEAHTTPEPFILEKLNRETHLSQVYPQMLSGHLQGAFLRMVVQLLRPRKVLEIGTFTGYSAIAMAMGFDGQPLPEDANLLPVLHTIEVNPEQEDRIRRFIAEAGMGQQIILHIGDAATIIPELEGPWDLVFIDADKPNYLTYYKMVLPLVRPGGFIIADNVLWDGKVTCDPAKMDRDTLGITEFNDFVHADKRVENLVLPVRDGLMIIRKNPWNEQRTGSID